MATGIATGLNKGHITARRELKVTPSYKKGVRIFSFCILILFILSCPPPIYIQPKETSTITMYLIAPHTPLIPEYP